VYPIGNRGFGRFDADLGKALDKPFPANACAGQQGPKHPLSLPIPIVHFSVQPVF
jgi:hypothetical protein